MEETATYEGMDFPALVLQNLQESSVKVSLYPFFCLFSLFVCFLFFFVLFLLFFLLLLFFVFCFFCKGSLNSTLTISKVIEKDKIEQNDHKIKFKVAK